MTNAAIKKRGTVMGKWKSWKTILVVAGAIILVCGVVSIATGIRVEVRQVPESKFPMTMHLNDTLTRVVVNRAEVPFDQPYVAEVDVTLQPGDGFSSVQPRIDDQKESSLGVMRAGKEIATLTPEIYLPKLGASATVSKYIVKRDGHVLLAVTPSSR